MPLATLLLTAILTQSPAIPLTGQVVDPTGAPIPEADVLLFGPALSAEPPRIAEAKTDADGRFLLERPADLAGLDWNHAAVLWTFHPDHQLAFVSFSTPLPPPEASVRIVMQPQAHAEFQVDGPDGQPVVGARVRTRLVHPNYVSLPTALLGRVTATTDAHGIARIIGVSPMRVQAAEVVADGFGGQVRHGLEPVSVPNRVILRPARPLEGRLVTEDGRPLRDWRVAATTVAAGEQGASDTAEGLGDYVAVAEDGTFRFPAIAVGRLMLFPQDPDGANAALDALRRLPAFRDAVDAQADAMGFPRPDPPDPAPGVRPRPRNDTPHGPLSRFSDLRQLDQLLADQERRAAEPPRTPIPGRDADPAARVAALIRDLDQIASPQMSHWGNFVSGPLVRDLIREGDPAVEPLLEALVSDTRLTRTITLERGSNRPSYVHPTSDAIIRALDGLMKTKVPGIVDEMRYTRDPSAHLAMAAAYRKFWEANRDMSLMERHYRTLADDIAEDRWLEAAAGLTSPPTDALGRRVEYAANQSPPLLGEPLRAGREPSVTSLLVRRAEELGRPGTNARSLRTACRRRDPNPIRSLRPHLASRGGSRRRQVAALLRGRRIKHHRSRAGRGNRLQRRPLPPPIATDHA
jgi:hypothetical protein